MGSDVLDNVSYARAYNSDHQLTLLTQVGEGSQARLYESKSILLAVPTKFLKQF